MVTLNTRFFSKKQPRAEQGLTLRELRVGRTARVRALSDDCKGFERERMLDLGLAPGARVERAYQAPLGGPIAFRLRGVTLALRPEQAARVAVELEN